MTDSTPDPEMEQRARNKWNRLLLALDRRRYDSADVVRTMHQHAQQEVQRAVGPLRELIRDARNDLTYPPSVHNPDATDPWRDRFDAALAPYTETDDGWRIVHAVNAVGRLEKPGSDLDQT